MEIELDLWSSRSSVDPVDSILSNVDCLGDVHEVDVDEFIMTACSSSADSTGAAAGESEAELDHHNHSLHLNHSLNLNNHMNFNHHHHHQNIQMGHFHQTDHQMTNPNLNAQMNLQQQAQQSQQDDLTTLNSHQHLHSLFDEANAQQSSSPSTMSFQHNNSHNNQTQNQLQHQQSHQNNLLDGHHQHLHRGARPLVANDCCNDLTSLDSISHSQQHQQSLCYEPQLQLHQSTSDYDGHSGSFTGLNGGTNTQHSYPQQSHDLVTTSSTATGQQQTMGGAPEMVNTSLVASRVDHCYILNDITVANGGDNPLGSSGGELGLSSMSSQLGQLRQVVASSRATSQTGVSSSTSQLLDRDQLQALLESGPQPISCSLGGESPLIAAINAQSEQQSSHVTASSKSGAKRRQNTPAGNGGPKRARQQQVANERVQKQTNKSTPAKGSYKRATASTINAENHDQSITPANGGSKSLARRNRTTSSNRKSKSTAGSMAETASQHMRTGTGSGGQVSPTLSSSSGVSSLFSSLSDDGQPNEDCMNDNHEDFREDERTHKSRPSSSASNPARAESSSEGASASASPSSSSSQNSKNPSSSSPRQRNRQNSGAAKPRKSPSANKSNTISSGPKADTNQADKQKDPLKAPPVESQGPSETPMNSGETPVTTPKTATKKPVLPAKIEVGVCASQPTFSLTKILENQAHITSSTGAAVQQTARPAKSSAQSQLSFEAHLSPSSRQKLNNLSSCLIINHNSTGQGSSGEKNGPKLVVQDIKACKQELQPVAGSINTAAKSSSPSSCNPLASSSANNSGNSDPGAHATAAVSSARGNRFSVSSSSSQSSSASSTSSTLANATMSPAGSLVGCSSSSSSSLSSFSTSSSCSTSSCGPSSITTTPAATTMSSPVSSASCSPTMQLGGVMSGVGAASSGLLSAGEGSPASSSSSSSLSLISSQDWKNAQTGQVVMLTEEERRTLVAEGYPIPQKFPLSKSEERSLKKIRRKIKNKISAQESRRKKKEYMEELEKRVQLMEMRIAELERENRRLSSSSSSATTTCSSRLGQQPAPRQQRQQLANNELVRDGTPAAEAERAVVNLASVAQQNNNAATRQAAAAGDTQTALDDGPLARQKSLDLLKALTTTATASDQPLSAQTTATTTTATATATTATATSDVEAAPPADDPLDLLDFNKSLQVLAYGEPALVQFRQESKRKNSVQSNFSTNTNDDEFIDDILMSQERQAVDQLTSSDDDLMGNLVGDDDVCGVDLNQCAMVGAVSSSSSNPQDKLAVGDECSLGQGQQETGEMLNIK